MIKLDTIKNGNWVKNNCNSCGAEADYIIEIHINAGNGFKVYLCKDCLKSLDKQIFDMKENE